MPIKCRTGKARYRMKKTRKGMIRLAFCGDKVIEAKKVKPGLFA